jgi:phosphopantothenoylcysteine decarboxylase/phosphopantothenate--cysteine ligase
MAEPLETAAALALLDQAAGARCSRAAAVITSGPTHEPIDPVRYIANRSSGKQRDRGRGGRQTPRLS